MLPINQKMVLKLSDSPRNYNTKFGAVFGSSSGFATVSSHIIHTKGEPYNSLIKAVTRRT